MQSLPMYMARLPPWLDLMSLSTFSRPLPYRRTLLPQCPTVLVVENALEDTRFSTSALVLGFPHVRFYAGGFAPA